MPPDGAGEPYPSGRGALTPVKIPEWLKGRVAGIVARWLGPNILCDRRYFDLWESHGFHITPVHFYEPIPDTRQIPSRIWNQPSEMIGVNFEPERYLELLKQFSTTYCDEYNSFPLELDGDESRFFLKNGFIGPGDAEVLYCMVRELKPQRVFEIGSGYSTLLIRQAGDKNRFFGEMPLEITCIDPYPRPFIKSGHTQQWTIISNPLENFDWNFFGQLERNDILFIDSSHVIRIGGDVLDIILEILPRLRKGVLIHIHDIFLPEHYPDLWVLGEKRFWTEQYLLHAFLAFNKEFSILWPGAYMRLNFGQKCEEAFPSFRCNQTWMGSFWLLRR